MWAVLERTVSCIGLASVQNIFNRSSLEHLHILCTPFNPTIFEPITQVLSSVQWWTLKSLGLSGDNIDEWIKLWPTPPATPQLLRLHIQATGPAKSELPHAGALFLGQLIYTSSLTELHLVNIQLQNKSDWTLLIEGLDRELLKTFDVVGSSHSQLLSIPDAVDFFRSKFP